MADVSPFAGLSRHQVLRLVLEADGLPRLRDWGSRVLERAHRTDPAGTGSLNDIERFVLLMQENRSFDHYFGTMSGVRGFGDSSAAAKAFRQFGYAPGVGVTPSGFLNPFRLDTRRGATLDGDAINDPIHSWGPQHHAWNNGAMDQWVNVHIAANGIANGPVTMGYYTEQDIPIHGPWPMHSPSATTISAQCSGRLTPTGCTGSRARSTQKARPAARYRR